MAGFPIVKRDALDAAQKRFWDDVTLGSRGFSTGGPDTTQLPGLYNAWLQFPEFGQLMVRLGDENRRRPNLSGKLREMVVITTSVLLNSRLEYDVHSVFARAEGLSDAVIKAIGEGTPPPFSDDEERTIFEANVQLVQTGTLTPPLREKVIGYFGLPGLIQLVAVVGLYVIVSYTVNVAEITLPKDFSLDPEKLLQFLKQSRQGTEPDRAAT